MKSYNLLIKPASSLCNLRCRYCFYKDEAKNRIHRSMGVMTDSISDALIKQIFQSIDPDGYVSFTFQGGEPTVAGLPFFQHFVDAVKRYRPQTVSVQYAIQTNGTLLNEEWAVFLKSNQFLVGLSLDGIRSVHEAHRIDAAGEGTWKKVLAAKSLLEKHGGKYNALCVVTGPCAQNPEQIYRSLKNLGFRHMQFIACLDPIGHIRGQEPWSLTPEAYGQFLCKIFDLWYRDWEMGNYHSIRLFDDYVHILLKDHARTCATCGKCGSYLVVEGDGTVYPCDFYALDDWKIGNIKEMPIAEMSVSDTARKFLQWGTVKPAECARCPFGRICNGGCKNDWLFDETGSHNYYCSAFKELLTYALPRLQYIAKAEIQARRRFSSR